MGTFLLGFLVGVIVGPIVRKFVLAVAALRALGG